MNNVMMEACCDELEKIAVVGPAIDLHNLMIPSLVGYQLGKAVGHAEAAAGKKFTRDAGDIAALLLVPGATGYQIGKAHGHTEEKEKKASELSALAGMMANSPVLRAQRATQAYKKNKQER